MFAVYLNQRKPRTFIPMKITRCTVLYSPLAPTFPSLCMTQACLSSVTRMTPFFSGLQGKSWNLAKTTHVFLPPISIILISLMNVYWTSVRYIIITSLYSVWLCHMDSWRLLAAIYVYSVGTEWIMVMIGYISVRHWPGIVHTPVETIHIFRLVTNKLEVCNMQTHKLSVTHWSINCVHTVMQADRSHYTFMRLSNHILSYRTINWRSIQSSLKSRWKQVNRINK